MPNAGDKRARAVDSTQVKTAVRGLRVHRLVIGLLRSPIRANGEMRKAPPSRTLVDDYPLE